MSLAIDQIYNRNSIEGMKDLDEASVDLILTDPPFAIDFKPHRNNYNRTRERVLAGYHEITTQDYPAFTYAWMAEARRVLKPSGSFFVFSGWNNLKDILVAADDLGLLTVNHLIWKYQFGVVCKRRFVTSHYHCLFFCLDDRKRKFYNSARFQKNDRSPEGGSLRYQDLEDVWVIQREYWHGKEKTPTKLPSEIIRKILAYTTDPGDLVLDPFLGSGQVAVVSRQMQRHYLGFEIVKDYFDFAQKQLRSCLDTVAETDTLTSPKRTPPVPVR